MIRRPPRSTRTDTLFPYTTLFRSRKAPETVRRALLDGAAAIAASHGLAAISVQTVADSAKVTKGGLFHHFPNKQALVEGVLADQRSEERRVGKECVSTCRSRWSPYH